MNMNEVMVNYENTLLEGITILNNETTIGGKKTSKKYRKKTSKKTSKKYRKKTSKN